MGLDPVPRDELLQPGALSKARALRQSSVGKKQGKSRKGIQWHEVATYGAREKKTSRKRTKVQSRFEDAAWDLKVGLWKENRGESSGFVFKC